MEKKSKKTTATVAVPENDGHKPEFADSSVLEADRILASKLLCIASEQLIWHNNIPTIDPLIFVDFCYKVVGVNEDNLVRAKLFYIKKKDGAHITDVVTAVGDNYKKGDEAFYELNQLVMKKSKNGFTYWKVNQK